jgi:tetratricopeptide (TPR) repeat protein
MSLKLPAFLKFGCSTGAGLILATGAVAAQGPCPPATDSILQEGWRAYRTDSVVVAMAQFRLAHRLCPENQDASVGLGFALLRQGKLKPADALFNEVLHRDSTNSDAWEGRTRSRLRLGDTTAAIAAGGRALALSPRNEEVRVLLNTIAPEWDRRRPGNRGRPAKRQVVARTRGRQFEISSSGSWRPFYIRGVNLGVALPGRYPSQFPLDSATYAGWLDTLAGMNANTVRLYTILPPAFYRALRAWNLSHPERPLWLIHGVWTELPPKHDFNAASWRDEFEREMRRVVDLVHGAATIEPRRGHAAGQYDADVSRWVLAYIIGREWEPFAVKDFDQKNPAGGYAGRYLQVRHAPAMDLWLAQQCDRMLSYEVAQYNSLRPIAYTNWPTLDPLRHPTEATASEEAYWRKRSGWRSEARKLEYENDVVGLDPNLVRPTSVNPAGWFASYHAYPYYPDFMNLDPGYRRAHSSEGASTYFGYLQQLVAHHAAIPTIIAEYGVPSSRGNAHLQVQGWGHGGHDERAMAAIDARLTREIREAGAAGSILFAWMDEWFKKNWAVIDYEIPLDNTRQWHNVMDPEQHYGILGQYPGEPGVTPQPGGDPARWRGLDVIQGEYGNGGAQPHRLRGGADESFWYLALELDPGRFPWDSFGIQLGIDTYQPRVGQHRMPRSQTHSELGFEFLIDLMSPDSASMRVLPEYNRYDARIDPLTGDDFGRFSRRPVLPRDRQDGRFDSMFIVINRARFGRDGRFFPAQRYERGRLRYGTASSSTLSDWFLDETAGLLELRIPWDLLNVTDPSTRTVLADGRTAGSFGVTTADAFHVGVEIYRKGTRSQVRGALPQTVNGNWPASAFAAWRWRGWSTPRSHARLKPVYDSLRSLWQEARDGGPAPPAQKAPSN